MKLLKRLLRDRKGVSLTEVVIAMAMVMIVTGAAISVLISSVKADARFIAEYEALTACENAVECVRFADDGETLTEALGKVGFTKSENEYVYTLTSGDDTVTVTVDNNFENYVVNYNGENIYTRNK